MITNSFWWPGQRREEKSKNPNPFACWNQIKRWEMFSFFCFHIQMNGKALQERGPLKMFFQMLRIDSFGCSRIDRTTWLLEAHKKEIQQILLPLTSLEVFQKCFCCNSLKLAIGSLKLLWDSCGSFVENTPTVDLTKTFDVFFFILLDFIWFFSCCYYYFCLEFLFSAAGLIFVGWYDAFKSHERAVPHCIICNLREGIEGIVTMVTIPHSSVVIFLFF